MRNAGERLEPAYKKHHIDTGVFWNVRGPFIQALDAPH